VLKYTAYGTMHAEFCSPVSNTAAENGRILILFVDVTLRSHFSAVKTAVNLWVSLCLYACLCLM